MIMGSLVENIRPILWVCALLLAWTCYQTWQRDYAPVNPVASAAAPASASASPPPLPVQPAAPAAGPAPSAAVAAPDQPPRTPIHVRTDVLDLQIDPLGGDITAAHLPTYPIHKDQPDIPVELLSEQPDKLFIIRSGLRSVDGASQPDHTALFRAERTDYELPAGSDDLAVAMQWDAPAGLSVEKVFHFRRGSYQVGLEYRVRNSGAAPYRAASYLQIERRHSPPERSYFNVDSYSFTGPVAYDGRKYDKIKVADLAKEPFKRTAVNGWIASIQHHFLAAAVPPPGQSYAYDIVWDRGIYTLGAIGPLQDVAPGADGHFEARLFVGPKLQGQLDQTAEGLAKAVDYGYLAILAQPLFWVLQKIHSFVGNWGWSIIIATFLIKAAFYKLTEASGRSMAKMRKIQPRLKALQDRYKDDRQALSTAMMELYKREKVNPAAGCLPDGHTDPVFHCLLLGAAGERGDAPGALRAVDHRSLVPRSVLRIAAADGCRHVRAAVAEPGAPGSGAGQGHEDHAGDVHGHVRILSGRPRVVLAHEFGTLDTPAMAYQ